MDIDRMRVVECEPTVAPSPAYGAVKKVEALEPGDYLIVVDNPCVLCSGAVDTLRASVDQRLELPFRADESRAVRLDHGSATCAAFDVKATVWIVPLVPARTEPMSRCA